ncbi:hypothetical protein MNAN1_003743 [Malassezia nana]|uniref:Uncharacterized protein n=1 Tax=Malassezia nana TaxID=180528 RepID=A0AAF0EQD3_9BASI|nr:hypothetical protein MNAN1_003743 [Malassezia nana]
MATVQYTWAFEAPADLSQSSGATDDIPSHGSSQEVVPTGESALGALAMALDTTRTHLNEIVTHWKDIVGPEQDSSLGIGNKKFPSLDRATDANDEEEEEETEEEE